MNVNNQLNTLANLPLSSMIGGPLTAAIEAQSAAAVSTLLFITGLCMKDGGDNAVGALKEIAFKYTTTEDTPGVTPSKTITKSVNVPLLFLVPIPFIRIESVNIAFTMRLSESGLSESTKEKSGSQSYMLKISGGLPYISAGFKGSFSSSYKNTAHSENRYNNEMNFDVNVQAKQDDMPGGLKKVFEILEPQIKEVEAPAGEN